MKPFKYLSLLLTILFTQSCVIDRPCKGTNGACPDSFESFFRIISRTDGKDLVYGSNKVYNKSEIKIFSTKGVDTTFATYQPSRLVKDGYDSVLYFRLTSKVDTIFMRLNNSDIDTITLSYGLSEGRCCSFNSIRNLNYNNTTSFPNYNGTVEFKK